MIRYGLCCIFKERPIKFKDIRACSMSKFARKEQLSKISSVCLGNSRSLLDAMVELQGLGIGAFRILSQFFPLYTHPEVGYEIGDLPDRLEIISVLKEVADFRRRHDIRLSFHPDQFVVLSSPHAHVVDISVRELDYQAALSEIVGADVINVHVGGTYGDRNAALKRFASNFRKLSGPARKRLTLENDDVSYTPSNIRSLCEGLGIPLVYDVHHHRCNPDGMSVGEATRLCVETWRGSGREPYFHISSPKGGWDAADPRRHADFVDASDFPEEWRRLHQGFTLDVEAKAKEKAVVRLMRQVNCQYPTLDSA